jgi:LacI family transcriptional regulator
VVGGPDDWERRVHQQAPDAFVLMEPLPGGLPAAVHRLGRPVVVVNSLTTAPVLHVMPDEAASAGMLLGHLHGLGHRRVAYAMQRRAGRHASEVERRDGIVAHARALGLDCQLAIVDEPQLFPAIRAGGATAVVAYNVQDALKILRDARLAGCAVPGDLKLCCWDNDEALRWSLPQVTAVDPPVMAMAACAVGHLLDVIEGRQDLLPERVVRRFHGELIVRPSTVLGC